MQTSETLNNESNIKTAKCSVLKIIKNPTLSKDVEIIVSAIN